MNTDEVTDALQEAFENAGYELGEVGVNRDRVRVAVRDQEASAQQLRTLTRGVVDEDDLLGLSVTTESADGSDGVTTVVSFRYRG